MDRLLADLRKLPLRFGPPTDWEQLQALADRFQCSLPAFLLALYRDHNGLPDRGPLPLRLMAIDEVTHCDSALRKEQRLPLAFRLFWTTDTNHYAGLYLAGPLVGMVALFDPEDPDPSPAFRSVTSLYQAILAAAPNELEWDDLTTDYPTWHPSGDQDRYHHELALTRTALAAYHTHRDEYERRDAAFCMLKLVPYEASHLALPLMLDHDMGIQAAACHLLGRRRYLPAIPLLAQVARSGMHNGKITAVLALGTMQHPQALEELLRLRPHMEPSRKGDLAVALRNYGYRLKQDRATWYYQAPDGDQWALL